MNLEVKILNGLERLSEALKSLLRDRAKVYGISPIQIQILLFVANHKSAICNVSYLAKEFNVTKPTISDAVRVLVEKKLLKRDFVPTDSRRYNLVITKAGADIFDHLSTYADPVTKELSRFEAEDLGIVFDTISKLIYQLNKKDIIQVQRTCFNCQYYSGNKVNSHYCNLLQSPLKSYDIRLDCNEFEKIPAH